MEAPQAMRNLAGLKTILTLIFLLICASSAFPDGRTHKVDKLFAPWDKSDTPGCALAIIEEGKILYERGYGMANLEHDIPITPQTVFYVGSISKQFVAMCVALLAKQEKISVEHDIRKYVPELQDFGTPITISHLIHHTSGLRDYLTLLNIAGVNFGFFHQPDVLELLSRQKELNFKPGDEYLYSNSGYFLLGVIVERVSGRSLREFAENNIFKPLGMKNSHFQDDYKMIIKNRATGYLLGGAGRYKNFVTTYDCVGAGGLFTSVEDLFLWEQNFYNARVGGKDIIDQMHTRGKLNNGKKLDYAYALKITCYKGLNMVENDGTLGGYRSAITRFPEHNFSVICLSNLSSFNPIIKARQVADIYLADQFKKTRTKTESAEKKTQGKPSAKNAYQEERKPRLQEDKQVFKPTLQQLEEYEGDYFSEELRVIFRVVLKEDKLYFAHRNAPQASLLPTLEHKFTVRGWKINFITNMEDEVSSFLLSAGRVRNLKFVKR